MSLQVVEIVAALGVGLFGLLLLALGLGKVQDLGDSLELVGRRPTLGGRLGVPSAG